MFFCRFLFFINLNHSLVPIWKCNTSLGGGKTASGARNRLILPPNQTRQPLPCLLILSFFYGLHNYCGKVELTCYEQVDKVEGHGEEDEGTIYRWQHHFFPLYLEIWNMNYFMLYVEIFTNRTWKIKIKIFSLHNTIFLLLLFILLQFTQWNCLRDSVHTVWTACDSVHTVWTVCDSVHTVWTVCDSVHTVLYEQYVNRKARRFPIHPFQSWRTRFLCRCF